MCPANCFVLDYLKRCAPDNQKNMSPQIPANMFPECLFDYLKRRAPKKTNYSTNSSKNVTLKFSECLKRSAPRFYNTHWTGQDWTRTDYKLDKQNVSLQI